ncbi:hypothetical protein BVRB_6g134140 isoform B [Beta vulgaris subsp. vulgaris]|nr:hypothetical protein BVRB_6g134140 isoform B [Beta vulgaris subsp. vulgaris]
MLLCKLSYGMLAVVLMVVSWTYERCDAFGFNIHHRFSDPVKAMLNVDDEFPEKGTSDYYSAMLHRDHVFNRRRLAGDGANDTTLAFASGNTTVHISTLGFLYYANVSVGTPESWYLVALDTGSHLFWLPCDCVPNCVTQLQLTSNEVMDLNIYSLRNSSTGNQVSCTSPYCENRISCAPSQVNCPYGVAYLSANTSSSGYLVEDLLHLTTNSNSSSLNVRIPFGCGVRQTGSFLETGAPNGLLGLTMDPISLPSVLASQNLTSNSYSMCFTGDGYGTIIFGDRDNNRQGETPLNPDQLDLYNVSITHITMGTNVTATNFTVIIDSGTSFTHLTEPAYSLFSEKFNSQVTDRRLQVDPQSPFEYCYLPLPNVSMEDLIIPTINLTMGGGDIFSVIDPTLILSLEDGRYVYCLGVFSSDFDEQDINIIGENFMTGYRIVFDHERMVLGWKAHDCGDVVPVSPRNSPPRLGVLPPRSSTSSALEHSNWFICILMIQILSVQLIIL